MRALTKPCPHCGNPLPNLDGVVVDVGRNLVEYDGRHLRMAPSEIAIIKILVDRPGSIVSAQAIHELMYGHRPDGGPDLKIVSVYICKVRHRLAEIGLVLQNFWSQGYMLKPAETLTKTADFNHAAGPA